MNGDCLEETVFNLENVTLTYPCKLQNILRCENADILDQPDKSPQKHYTRQTKQLQWQIIDSYCSLLVL